MSRLIEKNLPLATLKNAIKRVEMLLSSPSMHPYAEKILTESLHAALVNAHSEFAEKYIEVDAMLEAVEQARQEGKA